MRVVVIVAAGALGLAGCVVSKPAMVVSSADWRACAENGAARIALVSRETADVVADAAMGECQAVEFKFSSAAAEINPGAAWHGVELARREIRGWAVAAAVRARADKK